MASQATFEFGHEGCGMLRVTVTLVIGDLIWKASVLAEAITTTHDHPD
jgi:hypothetical protein